MSTTDTPTSMRNRLFKGGHLSAVPGTLEHKQLWELFRQLKSEGHGVQYEQIIPADTGAAGYVRLHHSQTCMKCHAEKEVGHVKRVT